MKRQAGETGIRCGDEVAEGRALRYTPTLELERHMQNTERRRRRGRKVTSEAEGATRQTEDDKNGVGEAHVGDQKEGATRHTGDRKEWAMKLKRGGKEAGRQHT